MATITERFGFTKPAGSEAGDVDVINSNTDLTELYLGRTQDSIAPLYDDTETYSVGDLRTYESRLYKCNTDISTPETFDPEKWDLTTAVQEGGGGGASAIEKTQAEYNALTPAQKTNGAIYMVSPNEDTIVELTEAQTDDTRVTASSYGYDSNFQQYHRPWCAFNRVSPTTWSYPTPGVTNETAWVPNIGTDGSNSWIRYEFDKAENMTSMKILAFADYSSGTTKNMIIEGSNDGETWDNILAEGTSFTLTASLHENYENEVDLDPTNAYKYVRLRSLEPMGASYQPSVFIDEIYVYGYGATDDAYKIYYMGTEYANTNGGSGGSSEAEDINYDNTTSQLTADNVQEAIDEVVANVGTASEDILTLQNVQGYDKYDETQTYAVGDYAIYNNIVYECTTAVSTAEPFDSTKWTATSIEQIIDGVKGDISRLNSSLTSKITLKEFYSTNVPLYTDTDYTDYQYIFTQTYTSTPRVMLDIRTSTTIRNNILIAVIQELSMTSVTVRVWKQVGVANTSQHIVMANPQLNIAVFGN
jgi:hypothetical protein